MNLTDNRVDSEKILFIEKILIPPGEINDAVTLMESLIAWIPSARLRIMVVQITTMVSPLPMLWAANQIGRGNRVSSPVCGMG
jgi:hypothetical protein